MMKYLLLIVSALMLTGCYEDTSVIIHEPGIYKGKEDKHALSAEERAMILARRFSQVQTDR